MCRLNYSRSMLYTLIILCTSKFTQPFNMPSSKDDILFSLRSNRISFDNPWNSVEENIGFKVSPNKLPANLRSSTVFCIILNDFSDNLLIEFCDKSSLTIKMEQLLTLFKYFFNFIDLKFSIYLPVEGKSCVGTEWWPAFLWVNTKTGAYFGKFTWSPG